MNDLISQAELKSFLHYDPETGVFTWIKSTSNRAPAGKVAGTRRKGSPYVIIVIHRRFYYAHRLAWLYAYGSHPDGMIDHIDNDPSNNRIANLRIATYSENVWNTRPNKRNKSGFKGVWESSPGRWTSYIKVHGQRIRIGVFDTPEEGARAYAEAAAKYHGAFANTSVDGQSLSVCNRAVEIAQRADMPHCEDDGVVYVAKEVDPRQVNLLDKEH